MKNYFCYIPKYTLQMVDKTQLIRYFKTGFSISSLSGKVYLFNNIKGTAMEIVNMMFEKYGGARVAGIFKNYLVLALLIKELMFSLFIMPEDRPVTDPMHETNTHSPYKIKAADSAGEDLKLFQVVHLMLTSNQPKESALPQTLFTIKTLLQHENI